MEEKAGILEYVSKLNPIEGIIKYRYSDFMVNEINLKDEVVRLTNKHCDLELKKEKDVEMEDCDITEDQIEAMCNLTASESTDILIEEMDKGRRTRMHQYIKKHHPRLSSATVKNGDGLNVIRVTHGAEKRRDCSMGSKDYSHFVMFKENKSTMEAIESLCRLLRVKNSTFSFAGTKDKRAVTSQQVTAFRVEPHRLSHLNKALRNVVLGNFRITQTPLKLGDLVGNAFQIIMRKVTKGAEEVEEVVKGVAQRGFVNYFGAQRFGTTEVCNSLVGRCIVKSEWTDAIGLIMKPRGDENTKLSACRESWQKHKDPSKALEALQGYSCVERKLLDGLQKYHARNSVAALSMIPRNMRLMYLHAYQSLVWNKIASRRIRSHHLSLLPGDLCQKEGQDVAVVTQETLGQYCIEDLVVPLAGHDVLMPENEVKGWIEEVLQEDGLECSSFKHNIRDYSLAGGYRKLIVRPRNLTWQLLDYTDDKASLLSSDLDLLNAQTSVVSKAETKATAPEVTAPEVTVPEATAPPSAPEVTAPETTPPPIALEETDPATPPLPPKVVHRALKLTFSLPSSSYATMLLREITKQDTSSAHQTTLN